MNDFHNLRKALYLTVRYLRVDPEGAVITNHHSVGDVDGLRARAQQFALIIRRARFIHERPALVQYVNSELFRSTKHTL